jgi:leader peptidase (prepilin peptidase)/N-methyltransferase
MASVILFVFGAVVGSFLNVFALRYNSGLSLGGRSACAHCGRKLAWFELVPILSYLFLGGRCRHCRTKISLQYPLVELCTAVLFVMLPAALLPTFCLYVAIVVYDARHKIIPDGLVYASIVFAVLTALAVGGYALVDWLAGPVIFLFFGALWLVSKGRAIGFGDAKLGLSIGLLLGAAQGFSAVICAFWIGAAYGLLLLVIRRSDTTIRGGARVTLKSEVPFAPFLVLGSAVAAFLKLDLFHVSIISSLFR